ncbi:hypothetical protein GW932_00890 [archaeon]|nr:hypothetical protein [archaeon]
MAKKFINWVKYYDEVFKASLMKDIQDLFGEFDPEVYQEEINKKNWDKKSLQLFIAYRTEITTKKLVYATWFLALSTIILSVITIFIK